MNHWLQTKLYACSTCKALLLHDKMYLHALFTCPARSTPRAASSVSSREKAEELAGSLAIPPQVPLSGPRTGQYGAIVEGGRP